MTATRATRTSRHEDRLDHRGDERGAERARVAGPPAALLPRRRHVGRGESGVTALQALDAATTEGTAVAAANACKALHNAHLASTDAHITADSTNTTSSATATDEAKRDHARERASSADFNAHIVVDAQAPGPHRLGGLGGDRDRHHDERERRGEPLRARRGTRLALRAAHPGRREADRGRAELRPTLGPHGPPADGARGARARGRRTLCSVEERSRPRRAPYPGIAGSESAAAMSRSPPRVTQRRPELVPTRPGCVSRGCAPHPEAHVLERARGRELEVTGPGRLPG